MALAFAGLFCLRPAAAEERSSGDAWNDPHNPVAIRFNGKRLDLWSLKVPIRPECPVVQNSAWVRNPIDAFILARLEQKGLTPSGVAGRTVLIRRLSYGLLGLPPTSEQVQEFLEDQRADAYERLVDRLLASRHYGVHWARHWLDVVRYADSNGFERDEFRPTAWRYRDYVVSAFNSNKPYDQFLREQLAGDELAGDRAGAAADEQRVAAGYLRLGPWDTTKFTNLDSVERARDELLVDITNTTASGFLGLTFNCCRCHDHKYDPFLQADYYRLRAHFAAVEFHDYPLKESRRTDPQVMARTAQLNQELAPLQKQMQALLDTGAKRALEQRLRIVPDPMLRALKLIDKSNDPLLRDWIKPWLRPVYREIYQGGPHGALATLTEKEKKQHGDLKNLIAQVKLRKDLGKALSMQEVAVKAPPTRVLRAGDFRRPREEVQPGVPSLFTPRPAAVVRQGKSTGRRTALGDWITSRQNPWTARVMVNRIWQYHFGKGLVATPDDFGHSGARPTHPELLDWLAVEFIESGWSVKHIQRLIVTSAAYRQSSAIDPQKRTLDPENTLLWRQNVTRLDAETLRDALLAVSGKLLPTSTGPPHWPTVPAEVIRGQPSIFEDCDRLQAYYADPEGKADVRSIFLVRKRAVPSPFLQTFNLPDAACTCGRRDVSTVAPQALMLLNNTFSVRMARGLAERLRKECGSDARRQVERAFRLALARPPASDEMEIVLGELARLRAIHQRQAEQATLADLCLALLNTNEFIYID
jgi:hypothetical protein